MKESAIHATTVWGLKQHKESKHEGIRYPCNECDYAGPTRAHLKRHKKKQHEVHNSSEGSQANIQEFSS